MNWLNIFNNIFSIGSFPMGTEISIERLEAFLKTVAEQREFKYVIVKLYPPNRFELYRLSDDGTDILRDEDISIQRPLPSSGRAECSIRLAINMNDKEAIEIFESLMKKEAGFGVSQSTKIADTWDWDGGTEVLKQYVKDRVAVGLKKVSKSKYDIVVGNAKTQAYYMGLSDEQKFEMASQLSGKFTTAMDRKIKTLQLAQMIKTIKQNGRIVDTKESKTAVVIKFRVLQRG